VVGVSCSFGLPGNPSGRRGFINVPFARGRVRTENKIADGVEEAAGKMLGAVILDLDKEFENLMAA